MERTCARDDGDKVVCVRERDGEEVSARGDDFKAVRVHKDDRGNLTSSSVVLASLSKVMIARNCLCGEDGEAVRVHEQLCKTASVRGANCKATQVNEYTVVCLLSRGTNEVAIVGRRKASQSLGQAARDNDVGAVHVPDLDDLGHQRTLRRL